MKLLDLVIAQEALQALTALELPAVISFQIARILRPIDAEFRSYEEARFKLIERLGEKKDNQIVVKPENVEEFNTEHKALLDVELELEITKLSPDVLGDATISTGYLMALWFLFEENK